jgi:hypothetical protein
MTMKQKDIIIANPIYDVVFKNLMTTGKDTNRDIAGYFVGTILGEEIEDIVLLPQEYSYHTKLSEELKQQKGSDTLTLIRLDFVATIRTKSGEHKKVLIEIQKSKKHTDLSRFRTYLGEQYKQTDTKKEKGDKPEDPLPIVIIYMLGFTLPKINSIAVKVNRTYVDMLCGDEIKHKDSFIESLTHDAYFVQIPHVNKDTYTDWEKCSELEQMLSLFEQDYFTEKDFYKKYPYTITDKRIKKMVETLEYIAADPITRRIMEEEYWAALNETIWESQVTTLTKVGCVSAKPNKNSFLFGFALNLHYFCTIINL